MAVKTTPACFTSLKEALLLHTRNAKLFTFVLLLLAVITFLVPLVHVVSMQPLADDMPRDSHLVEIKKTGPFSAEYARLLNEIKHDVLKLVIINIAPQFITPALGFVKQIIAFLAASTTYFGEIMIHKTGSWITDAVVALLQVALLSAVMRRHLGVLSVQGLVFLLAFLVFLVCWNN